MGLLEPITHKDEIEGLISSAKSMYDDARGNFEEQKEKHIEKELRKVKKWEY